MTYDAEAARAAVDAAKRNARPPSDTAEVSFVEILTTDRIRELVAAQSPDEPLVLMVLPKYAREDAEGWIYTVHKVFKTNVDLAPLGGGRILRCSAELLVIPTPEEVLAYDEARRAAPHRGPRLAPRPRAPVGRYRL